MPISLLRYGMQSTSAPSGSGTRASRSSSSVGEEPSQKSAAWTPRRVADWGRNFFKNLAATVAEQFLEDFQTMTLDREKWPHSDT